MLLFAAILFFGHVDICRAADFDTTVFGFEFIFHELHNLLLAVDRTQASCYFMNLNNAMEHEIESVRDRQEFEQHLVWAIHHNQGVAQTTLIAMRDKYTDRLADFHCLDMHVYEILPIANSHCGTNRFQCANGRCIPMSYTCDRDNDCGDHSDETLAICQHGTVGSLHSQCQTHHFICGLGHCIASSLVCNGVRQCHNGADELNCP